MSNLDSISLLIERIERNINLVNEDLSKVKELLSNNEIKKSSQQYPWNKEKKYEWLLQA